MNRSKLRNIRSLDLNLNDNESSKRISELFNELKKNGVDEIKITIEASNKDFLTKSGIDSIIFENMFW